jgi:predicted DNA-binding protein
MNTNEGASKKRGQGRLLDRFTKQKPQFKSYKFDLSADLHERLEKLAGETGMTKDSINDALNYAVRSLVTRLEREAKQASNNGDMTTTDLD